MRSPAEPLDSFFPPQLWDQPLITFYAIYSQTNLHYPSLSLFLLKSLLLTHTAGSLILSPRCPSKNHYSTQSTLFIFHINLFCHLNYAFAITFNGGKLYLSSSMVDDPLLKFSPLKIFQKGTAGGTPYAASLANQVARADKKWWRSFDSPHAKLASLKGVHHCAPSLCMPGSPHIEQNSWEASITPILPFPSPTNVNKQRETPRFTQLYPLKRRRERKTWNSAITPTWLFITFALQAWDASLAHLKRNALKWCWQFYHLRVAKTDSVIAVIGINSLVLKFVSNTIQIKICKTRDCKTINEAFIH